MAGLKPRAVDSGASRHLFTARRIKFDPQVGCRNGANLFPQFALPFAQALVGHQRDQQRGQDHAGKSDEEGANASARESVQRVDERGGIVGLGEEVPARRQVDVAEDDADAAVTLEQRDGLVGGGGLTGREARVLDQADGMEP